MQVDSLMGELQRDQRRRVAGWFGERVLGGIGGAIAGIAGLAGGAILGVPPGM